VAARNGWLMVLLLSGVAAVCLGVSAMMLFYIAPTNATRARTISRFLGAARSKDRDTLRLTLGTGAQIDEDFRLREVPASTGFAMEGGDLGFDDTSCVRGVLLPQRVQLALYLAEQRGKWNVVRAANSDPECADRLGAE
jgi:hypothetical protein